MNFDNPQILNLSKFGSLDIGFLSVAEVENAIPFPIKRVYWVYQTPENQTRGDHANLINKQVIICLNGTVEVFIQDQSGKHYPYILNDASKGLYIPAKHWRKMIFSENSILLCICSEKFDDSDYIKDSDQFIH
ncbi:FdtA/QdtA family cupin domain-containing protein [Marivirga sp.]|uniref:sugar 3,4-ketoisomerase n=1 Tax=Marivirga sp. TaxID=2018662 RepID=UPI0025D905DA|nr:FdtA/QdtA family cupin domain-containing protein [Marivirga sp.]